MKKNHCYSEHAGSEFTFNTKSISFPQSLKKKIHAKGEKACNSVQSHINNSKSRTGKTQTP